MKIIVFILLLFVALKGLPQQSLKKIGVGEILPQSTLLTSGRKLTILDFWNVTCTSCISAMPKMEALQKKFGDDIEIILVTNNSSNEVDRLFGRIKIKRPELKMITGDSVFQKLFPHTSVPHHVWIDSVGTVKYITHYYNANEENIAKVLEGRKMNFAYKNETIRLSYDRPLIDQPDGSLNQHIQSYSYVMEYLEEVGQSFTMPLIDSANELLGVRIVNMPLISLFQIAFGKSLNNSPFRYQNRVILNIGEKDRLQVNDGSFSDSWKFRNVYSYEAKQKVSSFDDFFKFMQEDLLRNFEFDASVKVLKQKALVLRRTSTLDKLKTRGGTCKATDLPGGSRKFYNQPFQLVLVGPLIGANSERSVPLIDKTGYSGNIDIELKAPLSNIRELNKDLKKYDLIVREEIIDIPMLVIQDKKKS